MTIVYGNNIRDVRATGYALSGAGVCRRYEIWELPP
jgi:hypothetical protein